MSQRIKRQDKDGLCTLTLSRPDKLNALDTRAFEEPDAQLDILERETDGMSLAAGLARDHYRRGVRLLTPLPARISFWSRPGPWLWSSFWFFCEI